MIVLHSFDSSPPCRAVLMVIDILGLEVHIREVKLAEGDHLKPEYLAKNPLHTIPLLEDTGFILADSHAIITYLVSKYGADKREQLYPNDQRNRALVNQKLFLDNTILLPRVLSIGGSIIRGEAKGPSEEQVAAVEEAYGFIEKYLVTTKYLVTDEITLADISCVATISSCTTLIPIDEGKFPKTKEWLQRLSEKKWYQTANVPGLVKSEAMLKQFLGNA